MATKDVVTTRIEESLLKANSLGQEKLDTFVKERLMAPKEDGNHKKLRNRLLKKKHPRFPPFTKPKRKRVRSLTSSKLTEASFNASLQRVMLVEELICLESSAMN